ncbi:MAG: hypothetical protein QM535_13010 [Limnohabitans sp.]|nr:hypothetical protein [Limnohabitans sp.]
MLDLKKLEEMLDKALANETSESLTKWLQEKRLRTYLQSLGEGTFLDISSTCSNAVLKTQTVNFQIQFSDVLYSQDYLNAA